MKTFFKYITAAVLIAGFGSCKKYLDVNTNPNAPTAPPINGLLTRVTQTAALNVFRVSNTTSYYVQYLASPNPSSPTDVYEPLDASALWTNLYDNMTDTYDLLKLATDGGATQYQGVAKVLMAMDLHLVHNLWGAAPYSQAFSGESLAPVYDDAQSIYQRCITLLDEAIANLQATGSTRVIPVATTGARVDLIHNGSSAAWIRTAYALKARLLNQLSKTPQYNAAAVLAAVGNAYTATGQDAAVNVWSVRNPWNQVALNNSLLLLDGWLSEYYVDLMDGSTLLYDDPRLPLTASLTRFNDYRGTRNGRGRVGSGTNRDESYVSLTGTLSGTASPVFIITYDEVKFIEAEASLRSNDRPRAYAAYLAAIAANHTRMGVSGTAAATYLANPAVSVGAANLSLATIMREKYKAMFLMPVTWDDARRVDYNYPSFQLPQNVIGNAYIRRLVYPNVELSRNSANVPAVSGVTQRLWWDQ